jgi:hypothetical protein
VAKPAQTTMIGRQGRLRAALLAAASIAAAVHLAAGGCYNPSIEPGDLRCAVTGKACPDGFVCAANRTCVRAGGPGGGAGGRAGGSGGSSGGGGGGGSMCANPVAPLCQSQPAGTACDPTCQNGCACGLRCNLRDGNPACVAAGGKKMLGEICNLGADDCSPGFICLAEWCGDNLGRCYRHCRSNGDCGADGVCNTDILVGNSQPSGFRVCELGAQSCDPYARTGCPHASLNCYLIGPNRTTCDCPADTNRQRTEGESCNGYNDCAPGLACRTVQGSSRCYRLCAGAADCPSCSSINGLGFCGL